MKIGDFFLGLFEALSRVYDGIMMFPSRAKRGLKIFPKKHGIFNRFNHEPF